MLIFELSSKGRRGYKLPELDVERLEPESYLGEYFRESLNFPEVSELDVVRHYTRLSHLNYAIDTTMVPLGSCTMKYNPRINE
ncbi:MAG: aminomethyl-transferring glycine dehydrogenase subunit GcvPB, partial [Aquificaceae bacterium]|nr:aminomethyl-transferring glycine dehydrogenase subunit GcvPB [Aquificaceae bacterium]